MSIQRAGSREQHESGGFQASPPSPRKARVGASALGTARAVALLAAALAISAVAIADSRDLAGFLGRETFCRSTVRAAGPVEGERVDTTSCRRCHPFVASLGSPHAPRRMPVDFPTWTPVGLLGFNHLTISLHPEVEQNILARR